MKNQFTINNVTEDIHDKRIPETTSANIGEFLKVKSTGIDWAEVREIPDSSSSDANKVVTIDDYGIPVLRKIKDDSINSETASSGQVLTADGNGNAEFSIRLLALTQAEYDAITTKDSNTFYFIKE